ncbi:tensin-like isoform X2 [Varroa destructor]|uniref:SH2 domain-containing protein n=1 Tax=Varroa destructor TaxID=109461 RepID=A0A7M7K7B9_VARDE|nr:tensin-like isoform X2 [Varroa destructor]
MHDYVEDGLKPCITFPCASLCAVVLGRDKSWRNLLNEYALNRCEDIMHPPAPLSPRNYYKYAPVTPLEANRSFHSRRTCSPFSYGIHPNSPVLQKRKLLAEGSYVTEGVGRRPPEEKDYRIPEPEYDYSPASWLEWKKHVLAQKHSVEDRQSTKRRQEDQLLIELKYSLDQDTTSTAGKPVVTVIKKDETMTRKAVQPVRHVSDTMPFLQRAAISPSLPHSPRSPGSPYAQHSPKSALRRQPSLPTRAMISGFEHEDYSHEREQEFQRPATPTRMIVPEIVRQMNEISEKQKRELERTESLRQRTRAYTPPPSRRSKSKSPVPVRSVSPVRYVQRSSSPHAIATLQAVNESLRKTAKHLSVSNEKLHRFTPERVSPPRTITPVVSESLTMPSSVSSAHWYQPDMTRDAAVGHLKDKQPGTFIVRNSTSYPGAYGLAMKVPDRGEHTSPEELVRHFLIEPAPGGVRVRGSDIESVFSSLNALVYQHSLQALSLPHRLLLTEPPIEPKSADKLLQSLAGLVPDYNHGVAFTVLYLGCHKIGMLTGPHAVKNAFDHLFAQRSEKAITIAAVIMKVSGEGITLTDHERRLFFRMHFPMKNFRFCDMDPAHRHWEYQDEFTGDLRAPRYKLVVMISSYLSFSLFKIQSERSLI